MNNHVHVSKYADYVLAARYDQMQRCYKMPMDEFVKMGYTWVVKGSRIEYKRPLRLGDIVIVRTWVELLERNGVTVGFEIVNKDTGKVASDGIFEYRMISTATGKPVEIPPEAVKKYSV